MATELGSPAFWDGLKNDPGLLAHEVCSINLSDLDSELQHHAAKRAWVMAVHEGSKVDEERAKWELTKARAKATLTAKAENDPHTGKSKTVAVLDAEVDQDPAVQEAMGELLDVQRKRGALRAMADALGDRRDMLVQLAAKHRDEQKEYR